MLQGLYLLVAPPTNSEPGSPSVPVSRCSNAVHSEFTHCGCFAALRQRACGHSPLPQHYSVSGAVRRQDGKQESGWRAAGGAPLLLLHHTTTATTLISTQPEPTVQRHWAALPDKLLHFFGLCVSFLFSGTWSTSCGLCFYPSTFSVVEMKCCWSILNAQKKTRCNKEKLDSQNFRVRPVRGEASSISYTICVSFKRFF